MFIKCDKKKVGDRGQDYDSAAFNSNAWQFIKRQMICTCSNYHITKRKRRGFIQKSMRVTCRAGLVHHECIRVDTRLKLDNMREMLGGLTVIGDQKRLPYLKVREALLYKNNLVYVVLCKYNFGNRDLYPCEDELDGAFGVDFQYSGCRLHIKAHFNCAIFSESNFQDVWLNEALTTNAHEPPINMDDLCNVRFGGTFRVCHQMYKGNEVTYSGLVMDLCVFPASWWGEVYGPTSIGNIQKMIQHFIR
jgi:hypothetical protein